ncbi:MAG: hypothetical protein ACK5A0_04645 [Polaromonas sp.]
MNWLCIWLIGHIVIPPVLYVGYGFVMSAVRDRDAGVSPRYVAVVDGVIAIPLVLLDGAYNALWLPFVCLDPRPHYAFRLVRFKGVMIPFFELATERLSRYNEQPSAWAWHKFIARKVAPFIDRKDPKGWHIRKAKQGAEIE